MTMKYMESQMQTAMEAAEANYRRDALFRRIVEMAVYQAMRDFDQFERTYPDDIDKRDVHHVAVTAALAALHLSIESDTALQQLTIERDHYKKLAEDGLRFTAPSMFVPATGKAEHD